MNLKNNFVKLCLSLFIVICLLLNVLPNINIAYATNNSLYAFPPKIFSFINEEDLKAKIINSPDFIKQHAYLAHYMGLGWCGGTRSRYVGEDFNFRKEGNKYVLQARYNPNDPHSGGFWADKRLKMTVSNVRFYIDTNTIVKGTEKVTNLDPIVAQIYEAVNRGNTEDTAVASFIYTKSKTVSKSTNISFEESFAVKSTGSVSVLFASASFEHGWSFKAGQSWTDTTSDVDSVTVSTDYQTTVPAKSKKTIKLISYKKKSEIPYTVNIYMDYDITFSGFLRWGGNARVDHPKHRPFVNVTFGQGDLTAQEEIKRMYQNRHIPGYSEWDWYWMENQFTPNGVKYWVSRICRPMGAKIDGKFACVAGTHVQVEASKAMPLTQEELGDSAGNNTNLNTLKGSLVDESSKSMNIDSLRQNLPKASGITIKNVRFNDTREVRVIRSTVTTGTGTVILR
ncbi:aerolysin family beta-barrel pore-forming toxin [Clostridiaceae bacterium M8S5]|nr:aerolysin family beta-barrel pore-forming toxin [Clostridiaceae bacterium M8S5]